MNPGDFATFTSAEFGFKTKSDYSFIKPQFFKNNCSM